MSKDLTEKYIKDLVDRISCTPTKKYVLMFTKEQWEYIDKHIPGFHPEATRITVPATPDKNTGYMMLEEDFEKMKHVEVPICNFDIIPNCEIELSKERVATMPLYGYLVAEEKEK